MVKLYVWRPPRLEVDVSRAKQLEERYMELAREWEERTRGLRVVTKEEYEGVAREVWMRRGELRYRWMRWSYYMRRRREALREGRRREAAAYLRLIRREVRRIRELRRELEEVEGRLAREGVSVMAPELEELRRRMEGVRRALEGIKAELEGAHAFSEDAYLHLD